MSTSTRQRKKMSPNCKACDATDTDRMVQCDACDGWFHFNCVGVDEAVAEIPWSCESCKEYKRNEEIVKLQAQLDDLKRISKHDKTSEPSIKSRRAKQQKSVSIRKSASNTTRSSTQSKLDLVRLDEELGLKLEYINKKYDLTKRFHDKKTVKFAAIQRRNLNVHDVHTVEDYLNDSPVLESKGTPPQHLDCEVCHDGIHHLSLCKRFLNFSVKQRRTAIYDYDLCRKCLGKHHASRCKSTEICDTKNCMIKHHSLLHNPSIHNASKPADNGSLVAHHRPLASKTLFGILPVKLYGPKDEEISTILELEGPKTPLHLKWTDDMIRDEMDSRRISLGISGITPESRRFEFFDVRTMKSLDLPTQTLRHKSTLAYPHLKGLPILEYEIAKPKILIRLNNYNPCLPLHVTEGNNGEPMATKTNLGWAVFASFQSSEAVENVKPHHLHECDSASDKVLHEQISEFFSTEHFEVKRLEAPLQSKYDQRAIKLLKQNTKKRGTRFVTGMLWRYDSLKLPNSYAMARIRLLCLEQKMKKNPTLAETLKLQINDYVSKGYARKLSEEDIVQTTQKTWYLPAFTVSNPNKSDKIRMVWDAAATVNGILLNSALLKGPDLLCPLPDILFRFHERRFVISGDIKEMYHQVVVLEEDQQAQRFLWQDNPDHEIEVYVMKVMTISATCSPSTAHYVRNMNAERFPGKNPRAVIAIKDNHYVDDWLDSFDSEREAIEVAKDVIRIHAAGGFDIRNFVSNSAKILQDLGTDKSDRSMNLDCNSKGAKVLGMWWSTKDDNFFYSINFNRIPSEIVDVKILLQENWRSAVTWDQPITNEQNEKWVTWTQTLPQLRTLEIPRPLTHVSLEADDEEALTPDHLLLGSSIGAKPFMALSEDKNIKKQYELSQQMAEHYCRRWIKEYLPILTRTTKWHGPVKPIEIGDIVVIMDDKLRSSWKKAKVIDVVTEKSTNQVRRVIVQTPKGVYTRCAAKVAVLDIRSKLNASEEVQFTEGEHVAESPALTLEAVEI